jgi:hypothetical protein
MTSSASAPFFSSFSSSSSFSSPSADDEQALSTLLSDIDLTKVLLVNRYLSAKVQKLTTQTPGHQEPLEEAKAEGQKSGQKGARREKGERLGTPLPLSQASR